MAISKQSLISRVNDLSKKKGVHQNIVLRSYFFDVFLKRLSVSKYSDDFVIKGGFLLSSRMGLDLGTTKDLNFLLRKIELEKTNIANVISEIICLDVGDNVSFELTGIDPIRNEDIYGGFRISLLGRLENIKEPFGIDIAVGDPVTPEAIDYAYPRLFERSSLCIKSYNSETILAEKVQTALNRGITSSRSKDLYDIFVICENGRDSIDVGLLKKAFINTCDYRKTVFSKDEALEIIGDLAGDATFRERWVLFQKHNKYAKEVSFEDAIGALSSLVGTLYS